MPTVTASDFSRNFGRYRDEAHAGPIEVTSHGRVVGAFVSAADLERFRRLLKREPVSMLVEEFPPDLIEAIEKAEYGRPAD